MTRSCFFRFLLATLALGLAPRSDTGESSQPRSAPQAEGSELAPRVFLIGDSTLALKEQDRRPETGWGEVLREFFGTGVVVENHAVNGRSSKSFRDEGRWTVVLERMRPGDFVVIQFGHNDEKQQDSSRYTEPWGSYQENLKAFAFEARERGAEPILLTPICRRKFDENGRLVATHGEYPAAVRALAKRLQVPLIDMQALSAELLQRLGDDESKRLFLHLEPGEHENYPQGRADDTHLVDAGAKAHAALFLEGLQEIEHPLARRVAEGL